MERVNVLEKHVRDLSSEELAEFRKWFAEFDAEIWDRQLEVDIRSGKLDKFADRAIRRHEDGESTKL